MKIRILVFDNAVSKLLDAGLLMQGDRVGQPSAGGLFPEPFPRRADVGT
jgi:hypothetical protein